MNRERRLRAEARDAATHHGHRLSRFLETAMMAGDHRRTLGRAAHCVRCGAEAVVVPGYSYEVFGEAVSTGCQV